jgi:8-oxo-dGTP diphosphatase
MSGKLLLVVAAALYDAGGRILLAQRPPGKQLAGLWEFPGGKLEAGETPEAALARELAEELSITVKEEELKPLTFASHAYTGFHLLMPLYACRSWTGVIQPREGQAIAWVAPENLRQYPAPPADIPLFDWLAALE